MLKKNNKENIKKDKIEPLDGEIYEVEKICEEFIQEDGNILYRISWKGYSEDFDTWEPIENLIDCENALEDWNRLKNSTALKKKQTLVSNKYIKKKEKNSEDFYCDDETSSVLLKKPFFLNNISKSDKTKDISIKKNKINNPNIKNIDNKKISDIEEDKSSFESNLNEGISFNTLNSLENNPLETFLMENPSVIFTNEKPHIVTKEKILQFRNKKKRKGALLSRSFVSSLQQKSSLLNEYSNNFEYITNDLPYIQTKENVKLNDLNKSSNHIIKATLFKGDFHKKSSKSKYIIKSKLNFTRPLSVRNNRKIFLEKLDMLLGPPVFLINEIDSDLSPIDFEFITSYKYGVGIEPRNPLFISGCSCPKDGCDLNNPGSCQCLEDSNNKSFSYDEYGRVRRNTTSIIYECNENCDCGINCPNRVVQRGRKIPLNIFKTKHKGWGLQCPRFIKEGTFIGVYLGELISQSEAEIRGKKYDHVGVTYLFDLDLFEDQVDEYYTIDAQYCGDVTRFINHSCDPNLAIYSVLRDKSDSKIYDLAFFAIKDIPALEELCFDYSGRNNEDQLGFIGNYSNSKYINLKNKRPCYCGSANCRGWLFG
ncbi:hypothetical protein PNEG_02256 [Pneumocystis murina B123]|uniref:Uncharacterized protein n=1 Tax=Pneumocystis murina (strain B123) TaxID=1069680 RepID=M7NQD6_PNEMU|nr:hypothetical protein PNEG_02256 [Pneumocystis murina B123]EMR09296.1 hypothetical protein PNEG_02256 [Pneumocystis murina B123]